MTNANQYLDEDGTYSFIRAASARARNSGAGSSGSGSSGAPAAPSFTPDLSSSQPVIQNTQEIPSGLEFSWTKTKSKDRMAELRAVENQGVKNRYALVRNKKGQIDRRPFSPDF